DRDQVDLGPGPDRQAEDGDQALGVGDAIAQLDRHRAREPAGNLDEPGRRPGMETGGIDDDETTLGHRVQPPIDLDRLAAETAAAATSSSDAPTLAWTPAAKAPSTSGASGTRTRSRSAGSSSSSASSRDRAALPKSNRTTAPSAAASLEPRMSRMAATIRSAVVPSRPSGVPPARATGTSSPPNWATMSRSPSTRVRLCETRTRPTIAPPFRCGP